MKVLVEMIFFKMFMGRRAVDWHSPQIWPCLAGQHSTNSDP
jgi:hypothetical protein